MQTAMAQKANRYEFSIEQAVAYAKKNNVQVKNALLAIDAQVQTNREIGAAAYPTIMTSSSVMDYTKIPVSLLPAQIFGGAAGTFIPVQFGTKFNANYGVNFNQILFDGQPLAKLKGKQRAVQLGFLAQSHRSIFNFKVLDVVLTGRADWC